MRTAKALERMPHRGAMLLIEAIIAADERTITCQARDHREADYPLRVAGRLATVALVELGAQAAAAHASLVAVGDHHVGLLLALTDVVVAEPDADAVAGPLTVDAEHRDGTAAGVRYGFVVRSGEVELLRGDALMSIRGLAP